MFCKKCGNVLDEDAVFCEKCGTEVVRLTNAINTNNTVKSMDFSRPDNRVDRDDSFEHQGTAEKNIGKRKMAPFIILIIILLLCAGGVCLYFFTDLFKSKEEFLQLGDYQKAYNKASSNEEKQEVFAEYLVAKSLLDYVTTLNEGGVETPIKSLKNAHFYDPESSGIDMNSEYRYCIALSCNMEFAEDFEYAVDVGYLWTNNLETNIRALGSIQGVTEKTSATETTDLMISTTKTKGVSLSIDAINRINKLFSDEKLQNIVDISSIEK